MGAGRERRVLQTISKGTIMNNSGSETTNNVLVSGSADNVRWQIVNANSGSGTFDLLNSLQIL